MKMRLIDDADKLLLELEALANEPDYLHPDEDWSCGVQMAISKIELMAKSN